MPLVIEGPAGGLEASYHNPAAARHAALLCHPHPSYGGSMHDAVLGIAANALAGDESQEACAHLRFNFRGVGASAGTFDNGIGEQDDLVAAWNWLAAQSNWEQSTLIGYSFGSAMAWAARGRCAGLTKLLLIAPPTAVMSFASNSEAGTGGSVATHIIVGSNDSYCNLSNLPLGASSEILDGGDHFFSSTAGALAMALRRAL